MNFIEECKRTEAPATPLNADVQTNRLLHAAIGIATESGELLDALKKTMYYGKPLDMVNVAEEIGDILWYIAIGLDACGSNFEIEMDRVIRKLRVRFPDRFSEQHAEVRDLFSERQALQCCRHDVPLGEDCVDCELDWEAYTK